jgi:hypothetical protein
MSNVEVVLNFPLDALNILDDLSRRQCEYRTVMSDGTRQPCTHVNPCLTCRARKANRSISTLQRRK